MRSLLSRMFSSRAVGAEGNSSFDLVDLCATFGSDPFLINFARLSAQRYELAYQEKQPCEQLVQTICNYKQSYTQFGGQRPFGVSFLYAGWDRHFGFQLYHSDPSGNYGGWKATAIGANNKAAKSLLKAEYEDDLTLASRAIAGTVYREPAKAAEQALRLVTEKRVIARSGKSIPLEVDTICIHGDEPTGVAVAEAVTSALNGAGVRILPLPEMTL